jgi:hypothetical protein
MVDTDHHLAFPKIENDADDFSTKIEMRPWNVFANSLALLTRGAEKLAHMQSSIDMTRVVCSLERYHLAHNEYPKTLDLLAPQFISQIPHDIIGGQPLHYRRTDDNKFLLYSIGWNETDDGGQIGLREFGSLDTTKGDWVWLNP